jgi:hypothetical protein
VEYKFSLVARATNRRDGCDFAVYERRNGNGGAVDYIIAREPPDVSFYENPGNGLEGFENREAAIRARGRLVTRPKPENHSMPVTRRMQRKKHFRCPDGNGARPDANQRANRIGSGPNVGKSDALERDNSLGEVMPLQFTSIETQLLGVWMNTKSSDERAAVAAQQLHKLLQGRGVRTVDFLSLQKQATPTPLYASGGMGFLKIMN